MYTILGQRKFMYDISPNVIISEKKTLLLLVSLVSPFLVLKQFHKNRKKIIGNKKILRKQH